MFDFSWGDGGVTIYWPNGNGNYNGGQIPPGSTYNPYAVNQTQISTGTLVVLALLAYLVLRK